LQKSPIILRSLLIVATPKVCCDKCCDTCGVSFLISPISHISQVIFHVSHLLFHMSFLSHLTSHFSRLMSAFPRCLAGADRARAGAPTQTGTHCRAFPGCLRSTSPRSARRGGPCGPTTCCGCCSEPCMCCAVSLA